MTWLLYILVSDSPRLATRAGSSLLSGLVFSHSMYFLHICFCLISSLLPCGCWHGALRSKCRVTFSYSFDTLRTTVDSRLRSSIIRLAMSGLICLILIFHLVLTRVFYLDKSYYFRFLHSQKRSSLSTTDPRSPSGS